MRVSKVPFLKRIFLSSLLFYFAIIPSGCNVSNLTSIPARVLEAFPFIKPPLKEAKLTYWGLFEPDEVIRPLIEEYQKRHPNVKIEYEQRAFSTLAQHKETLLTRFREGTGPDIARIHNTWVPQFAPELSPVPSNVFSSAEFAAAFYPVAQNTLSYQGNLYAIPLMYEGLMLFINNEHFEKAGIEKPPSDWEEFRADAVKLTKTDDKGNITQAGAALGTASNIAHFSDVLGLMFAQSNVEFPSGLTSDSARDALTFYTNFSTKDNVWSASLPPSVQAFARGQVSMIFAPSWRVFDIKSLNPGLKFRTASVPQIPSLPREGPSSVNWASFWAEAVNLDSPNKGEAWEFLEFLSESESLRRLYAEEAKLREFGEPYSRVDLGEAILAQANLAPLIDGAPTATSFIIADASGNDVFVEAVRAAVDAVLQKKDVGEALSTLQKTVEQFEKLGAITGASE